MSTRRILLAFALLLTTACGEDPSVGPQSTSLPPSAAATVPTITLGEPNILPYNDTGNGNLLVAQRAVLSQAATLQTLSFYVTTPAGRLRLGLYDATGAGGGPGAKKAETAEITPVGGWNTAAVSTPINLPAGTYWLAYLSNSNSLGFRMAETGNGRWYSATYGVLPNTFSPSASSGSYHWSFYATLGLGAASQPPTVATAAAATPNPVSGTSTTVSVLGADDGGEASLTYTWTATGSPPAPVSFSPNGTNAAKTSTASFARAGTYTLQATIADGQGQTATSSVSVTVSQVLTSISVSPATSTVAPNGTRQFTAATTDQFGQPMTSQPTFAWSVSGGGTISSSGLFTAGASAGGPFTVTAAANGRSGFASVSVGSSPPAGITGLDFPGSGGFRAPTIRFRFTSPPSYPATYIMQVYPRAQPNGDLAPYYTAFFYGNEGAYEGDRDYYGFHPYPDWSTPKPRLTVWEIAAPPFTDYIGPRVVYDRWYQQAAVVTKTDSTRHTFYWDFNDPARTMRYTSAANRQAPTNPGVSFGDAPWNEGNEIWCGVIRGIQIYDVALTPAEIAQEIASPGSSAQGSHLWYLNLNPTPTDISDKSGKGHNPQWVGSLRPSLWTGP